MQQSLFFDGQNVLVEDVSFIETSVTNEVTRRIVDISSSVGIIGTPGDGTLEVTSNGPFSLLIAPGSAYDSNGEYIKITNPVTQSFGGSDTGKFVVVRYLSVDNTPVAHPITGALTNTRRTDSFTTTVLSFPATTDVILAKITAISGGNIATLSDTQRQYWSARLGPGSVTDADLDPNGAVITHINTFGTGTVTSHNPHGLAPIDIGFTPDATPTTHQLLDHSNGFEAGTNINCALVTVNAVPAPDSLNIQQTGINDSFIIAGVRLNGSGKLTATSITFADGTVNPALYEIVLNSNGTPSKSTRATYNAAKNITGVQITDVSTNHASGSRVLSFTASTKTLTWDNGQAVTLDPVNGSFNGDAFYTLKRSTTETQNITIWVDFSSLPVTDQTDAITIVNSVVSSSLMLLSSVPWSGSATGFLGFGDQGASGSAIDRRTFGNLNMVNIDTQTQQNEFFRRSRENSGNGFVNTPGFVFSGAVLTFNIPPSTFYLEGQRFDLTSAVLTLTNNATNFVFINKSGVWATSTTHPQDLQPVSFSPFILGAIVVTAGGTITGITDVRRVLTSRLLLGDRLLNTESDALSSRINIPISTSSGVDFTLAWESARFKEGIGNYTQPVIRIYLSPTGQIFHTVNARWTGTQYVKDVNGIPAFMKLIGNDHHEFNIRDSDVAWTTWTTYAKFSGARSNTLATPNFSPLYEAFDAAGNRHVIVDHLGFIRTPHSVFNNNWITPDDIWSTTSSGTATTTTVINIASNKSGPWLRQFVSAINDQTARWSARFINGNIPSGVSLVMEGDVDTTDIAGTAPVVYTFGLRHDETVEPSTNDQIVFRKDSSSANWLLQVRQTASLVSVNTGVAATGVQNLKIEVLGSGYTNGPRVLGYINGVLVGELTVLPDQGTSVAFMIYMKATGLISAAVFTSPVWLRMFRKIGEPSL